MFCLNENSEKFIGYLESKKCYKLLKRNKMSIHIKFVSNFFTIHQDYDKTLLQIEFTFSADYHAYISEYLMAIKYNKYDMYNMLNLQYCKFLFYNVNDYLNRRGLPVQCVRHTMIFVDTYAVLQLQKKIGLILWKTRRN